MNPPKIQQESHKITDGQQSMQTKRLFNFGKSDEINNLVDFVKNAKIFSIKTSLPIQGKYKNYLWATLEKEDKSTCPGEL